jgi:hypothetical protein
MYSSNNMFEDAPKAWEARTALPVVVICFKQYLWDPLEVKLWNSAITTAAPKSRELPVSYH